MPPTVSTKPDDMGPSFVPITLQASAQPFISGATTIVLTITPQSTPPNPLTFSLGYYYIDNMALAKLGGEAGITVDLEPLPDTPDHYFANPPDEPIPMYGSTAVYNLETLATITELAGKTLVITAVGNGPEMVTSTAAITISIANPV